MSTVITLQNLTKCYGEITPVNNVNLEVADGEILGFIGPNGAGKTTTLRMIMGELRPTSGSLSIFGKDPFSKGAEVHRDIGYVTGDMALNPSLTGEQFLHYMASLRRGREVHIRALANRLHAEMRKPIKNLSRGNRQKIALIAAFMHQPKLLVMDEPSSGFDPIVQQEFATLVCEHRARGGSAIISSHILNEVQHLCDRVAFIRKGELVKVASMDEVLLGKSKSIRVMAEKEVLKKLMKLKGATLFEPFSGGLAFAFTGEVAHLLDALQGEKVLDLSIEDAQLETEFQSLYQGGAK